MDCYYTYLLIDPRDGLPFYVGKGKKQRCFFHIKEARYTTKNSAKLQKIRKIESLGMEVIVRKVEQNVSDSQAQELEVLIIAEAKAKGIALTNRTNGGDGGSGYRHTTEAREKMSKGLKGRIVPEHVKDLLRTRLREYDYMNTPAAIAKRTGPNSHFYGKPSPRRGVTLSDELKQKISASLTGEKNPRYGKKFSPEERAAMSASTKGIKKSDTSRMRKPKAKLTCPHCGKVGGSGNMQRWHFDNCKLRK